MSKLSGQDKFNLAKELEYTETDPHQVPVWQPYLSNSLG